MGRHPHKRTKRQPARETVWLLAVSAAVALLFYGASVEITRQDYGPVPIAYLQPVPQPPPQLSAAPAQPQHSSHTVTQTQTVQTTQGDPPPVQGGSPPPSPQAPEPSPNPASRFPMDINAATQEDLMEVDGIGQVKSGRILDYLALNGPVTSMDQLLEVSGIGEKTLEKLKELFYAGE